MEVCPGEKRNEGRGKTEMGVVKVDELKFLGSTIPSDGQCTGEEERVGRGGTGGGEPGDL